MAPLLSIIMLLLHPAFADETAAPAASPTAKANFSATERPMTVAIVEGHGEGTGSVRVKTTFYRDLCMTPCAADLPAGLYELRFYGGRYTPVVGKYQLKAGSTNTFQVEPKSLVLRKVSFAATIVGVYGALQGSLMLIGDGDSKKGRTLPASTEKLIVGSGLALGAAGGAGMVVFKSKVTLQPGS